MRGTGAAGNLGMGVGRSKPASAEGGADGSRRVRVDVLEAMIHAAEKSAKSSSVSTIILFRVLEGSAITVSAEYKYRAFISYSHKDEKWASWLHNALETFKVPKHLVGQETGMGTVPERMGKVFRDREELSSSASLGAELTQALEDSACQIVICSPNAAKSHWTNEEVLTYKRLGRENRVFCLIVDGEPGTDQECFPQAVRFQMGADGVLSDEPAEPIAADARPHADGKFNAKLKLIAGMLGVGFDDLKQRELVRQKKRRAIATAASIAGLFVAATLVYSIYLNLTAIPPVEIEPVSVLIADFDNQTGDPLFDGSLEQAFEIGLEIAPFITSYSRTDAEGIASEIAGDAELDAGVARLVAVRENIGMVLSGSIVPDGSGYDLTVAALEPQGGEVIAEADADAADKSSVLSAVGQLASELTEELGGDVLEDDIVFSSDTFTAASLEAVKNYTIAQDLQHQRRDEEATEYYARAVELDPNFTRAYSGWALSAFVLGRIEKSDELWSLALANLDRVTERERLRTLGLYYSLVSKNFPKALESYRSLVTKYPADEIGQNNLAVALFDSLNFEEALVVGKKVHELYPASAMYQTNYALCAMYASNFETASVEARAALEKSPDYYNAWLPIAIKGMVDGDFEAARRAYESMRSASDQGAPLAEVGLGDVALYSGEFQVGREHLARAIQFAGDHGNQYVSATAHMAIAFSHEAEGNLEAALEVAARALEIESGEPWVVQAALLQIAAGDIEKPTEIAASLTNQLQPRTRAYGTLIDGLIAHSDGRAVEAIEKLSAALELADLWLVRFYLGKIYLDAGYFAEAIDEFIICMERRGEAAALFLDDISTYRYVAPVYYWLGRAEAELGMGASAKDRFRQFIELRPKGGALVEDAKTRL